MKKAKFAPYPCHCGGKMVEMPLHVQHLGIDFGLRTGHVCTRCGDEFLTEETWQEVEGAAKAEVSHRGVAFRAFRDYLINRT